MNEKIFNSLAAAYILIWIITFGHAVNRPVDCDRSYVNEESTRRVLVDMCHETSGFAAVLKSMLWPFYWSAQAFKGDA